MTCGACCATFRVFFHWSETLPESHGVPSDSCTAASPHLNVMNGTDLANPRCNALLGSLGESVQCSIYDQRPGPCRNFKASLEDGTPNSRCDQARMKNGLNPLSVKDWIMGSEDQ